VAEPEPTLIYLDTNVYARPFDDQTQPAIQAEANAFLAILAAVKAGRLALLSSGILAFEVAQILSQDKRDKVEEYLLWRRQHIAQSDEVLDLGGLLERRCRIRTRDALHVASALLGGARYFLSCDRQITEMKQARCYRRLAPPSSAAYFSAMNPRRFAQKLKKGEIE
jgi:predicted nucleic acid-binding protein